MMKNIENFKNEILFNAIHNWERSDVFWDLFEQAEKIVKYSKGEPRGTDGYYSFLLFLNIATKINYSKNLIMLCADLKKKNYVLQKLVKTEDNHYENIFKERNKKGNHLLKKLRPYVLEYTKEWPLERKEKELNNKKIEPYLRGWFCSSENNSHL